VCRGVQLKLPARSAHFAVTMLIKLLIAAAASNDWSAWEWVSPMPVVHWRDPSHRVALVSRQHGRIEHPEELTRHLSWEAPKPTLCARR
jgi:hypothetical protein